MASTIKAHIVNGAPEGIVRVFVPGVDNGTEERAAARKAAQATAHTIHVGRTPVGKRGKVDGVAGYTFDFAPVTRQSLVEGSVPQVADGKPGKGKGKGKRSGKGKGKATPNTFVRDVIAPRAARRAAVSCKRCEDFGIVPTVGKRAEAGKAFRTVNGATSSPSAGKCPACKGKSKARLSA